MNALSHTTYRVLPNRRSSGYTPGLHGCPSSILIGTRNSKPPVGGRASTSELSSLADLSLFKAVSNFVGLSLTRV
jgi:hypothetical protein